jgi:maltose O-acetyltransferase
MRPHSAQTSAESIRHASRLVAIRVLGYVTNHVVAHVPSYAVRHAWYRMLGASLGAGSRVHLNTYVWFNGPGHIRRSGARIGDRTVINRGCTLDLRGPLHIGDDVSISPEVAIITNQHAWREPGFALQTKPVFIDDHAWIGLRATILPGVRIGRGAVVAAGAVVTRDVPPGAVVAGVPATVVAARPEAALGYALDGPRPLFE